MDRVFVAKNKPDLKDKPSWASYWAQDEDGRCSWFEETPACIEADRGQGVWIRMGGRSKFDQKMPIDAQGWAYSVVRIDGQQLTTLRTSW